MQGELVFREGERALISHLISNDETFVIDSATITIYKEDLTALITNQVVQVDNEDEATQHEIYYQWNTTGVATGHYVYVITYNVGTQAIKLRGEASVLPIVSRYDRWIRQIRDWIKDTPIGEAQALISETQYRTAANQAVKAYSAVRPRRMTHEQVLTTAWEYDLPEDWDNEASLIERFDYPYEETTQLPYVLEAGDYFVDPMLGKWRFLYVRPSAGEIARFFYSVPHTLNDTTDTIPTDDFESVAKYAAGVALGMLASKSIHSSAPDIGADFVSYRTKRQEYQSQAERFMTEASALWSTQTSPEMPTQKTEVVWNYMTHHGRVEGYW